MKETVADEKPTDEKILPKRLMARTSGSSEDGWNLLLLLLCHKPLPVLQLLHYRDQHLDLMH